MHHLKAKRSLLKGALTRTWTFILRAESGLPVSDWECRLEHLEDIWHQYVEVATTMLDKCENDDEKKEIEDDFEVCEERVLKAKGKFRQYIAEHSIVTTAPSAVGGESLQGQASISSILSAQTQILNSLAGHASVSHSSFLPKLKIKSFDGNLIDWKSFHDSFVSSIHNKESYTACQKFQLLKSFLTDQPYEIIGHIPESNENYAEAWSKLCNRYNTLGLIAGMHVSKFFKLSVVRDQSAVSLRRLYDVADETIRGLRSLGAHAESRDVWLIYILVSKFDSTTAQEWTKFQKSSNDFPKLEELLDFLNITCEALESVATKTPPRTGKSSLAVKSHQTTIGKDKICAKCSNAHDLTQCQEFIAFNTKERRRFVGTKRICYNCLRMGHISSECRSKHSCRKCNRRHHTLLHEEGERIAQPEQKESTVSVNFNAMPEINTLLPTAVCNVSGNYGEHQQCRVLIDTGSEKTLISESCVQRLDLRRKHARIPINGVSGTHTGISRGWVSLHIESRVNSEAIDVDALIMPTIAASMPAREIPKEHCRNFLSLQLADPLFYMPAQVDILLGMEKVFNIFQGEKLEGSNKLSAISTSFGWVIGGDLSLQPPKGPSIFFTNVDIDHSLVKFWEAEEVSVQTQLTDDELKAENSFVNKHKRLSDGTFSVELPLTKQCNDFGNSYEVALKRLMATERRLNNNAELKSLYVKFMTEYIELNHMEKIPNDEIDRLSTECFYLPHHPVFKNDSTTTRLRVVFDGSAHSLHCPSLNEALLVGPSLLRDLFAIVLRFRSHRYVMSADVEKMYRMIWVHDYHRDLQRILWRTDSRHPLEHYRLKTVTYGTACAPFLAVRVLDELGRETVKQISPSSKGAAQGILYGRRHDRC